MKLLEEQILKQISKDSDLDDLDLNPLFCVDLGNNKRCCEKVQL